jgi:hypothetical protein
MVHFGDGLWVRLILDDPVLDPKTLESIPVECYFKKGKNWPKITIS